MMNMLLKVGDIFTSKSLAKATWKFSDGCISDTELEVSQPKTITHCWVEKGEDGWERRREDIVNLNADSEERGEAEFLVVSAKYTGGGTGHGPHDIYPDGWKVKAIRLDKKETVEFYQSGCFSNKLTDVVSINL